MLGLLGFLAFITLILGPIGFFLSLGVRPRISELERARGSDGALQSKRIADLEQRLRRIEERIAATASPPGIASPAQASPAETPAPPVDAEAALAVSVALATPAPSDPVAVAAESAEETSAAKPLSAEETTAPPSAPAHDAEPALADPPPLPVEPEAIGATIPDDSAEQVRSSAAAEAPRDDSRAEQIHATTAAPPPPDPPARLRSLEEAIGTRWTVWIGGLALALGAILLVRLSIERGVFGPPVRIALGFLLAAVLVGAGEFLRRRDIQPEGDARAAYIPGMLTATGTIAAFGTVYAAYALYHFIGPTAAFVALGVIGVACMAAAALHGPALAGLGLAGSLVTPLLVQSDDPSPWSLVIYIGVVSTTAHALSWLRNWLWLSPVAGAGAAVWAVLLLSGIDHVYYQATMVHIVVQTALAAAFMAVFPFRAVADEDARPSRRAEIVLAAAGILTIWALLQGSITGHFGTSWLLGAAIVAVILALTAVLAARVASAIAVAGLVVLAAMILWPPLAAIGDFRFDRIILVLLKPDDPARYAVLSACGCLGIAMIAAGRLLRAGNLPFATAASYAAAATLTPLAGLAIVYLRLAQGAASLPLAAAALLLAAAFAGGAWLFLARRATRPDDTNRLGLGALASSAIAAAAFALVFALDGGTLTVALALAAVGTAFVAVRLDLAALRWCVAALGVLVAARLAWDPRIVGGALSTTPIFNWLLFGYGVPALSFLIAGRVMRTRGDDTPVRVADALGLLFSAFLVFFEIRHAMNGGDPFARGSGLLEQGLLAVASFGFGIVLVRLDASRSNVVFRIASLAAGAIGMGLAVIGLGLRWNPLLTREPIEGGTILNALLLCYLLPGLLAGLLASFARQTRPAWYWGNAGAISLALCIGYLIMQTRVLFHGQTISLELGSSLAELGLDTVLCLVVAAGIAWTLDGAASTFRRGALIAIGALAAIIGVLGLGFMYNPLLRPEPVPGGTIFNTLIVGYLLPALAAWLLARAAARAWPLYRQTAAAAAFVLGLSYLLFAVRLMFQGPVISFDRGASLAELGVHATICLAIAAGIALMLGPRATSPLKEVFVAVMGLACLLFIGGPGFGYNPLLHLEPVAGGVIFNALIPGYVLPAFATAVLALIVRSLRPAYGRIAGTVAAALALAWLILEVRVLFHGTSISFVSGAGIAELGIDTAILMVVSIALLHGARMRHSEYLLGGAMAVGALALVVGVLGLGIVANPLFTGVPVGGNAIFNNLLVGYGLTAALAFVLAREASRRNGLRPPPAFRVAASIAAIVALFVFVTLETRRVFQGESIWFRLPTSEAEWYAYSAVWLVLGIALLAYGLWRRSITVRLASGLFVLASVVKVFLFDLSGLEGILRATSFIGLGLALIGIGLAYQKLVFADRGDSADRNIPR
jgi:uncharacterized membrane protein